MTHAEILIVSDDSATIAAHLEAQFNQLTDALRQQITAQEQFTLTLTSERSQFTRFNHAKVRQTGAVADGTLHLTLMQGQRSSDYRFPFTGNGQTDRPQLQLALDRLRQDLPQLPENPYLVQPTGNATSRSYYAGALLSAASVVPTLLPIVADLDFTGLYAAGLSIRAYADSTGQQHWFATDSFCLDYSLFTPEGRAVKGTYAGSEWDEIAYTRKIQDSRRQLDRLSKPAKSLPRGQYRTYFAPAATADLLSMLSWGGVSEASYQQGGSCFTAMRQAGKVLSEQLTIRENFQSGLVPRFNDLGELAPLELTLIEAGQLVNLLVSAKTAQEYDLVANGASQSESLRSPEILPGNLRSDQILSTLDTGLYLSNLHYLNWSDRPTGRITGMTRYACFWVEGGEIVAPIENLRFDDSLYHFWGENLLALTDRQDFIPDVNTYTARSLGGVWVPGMVVENFTYTL